MRIAQVAPLFESVPPKLYGGTERVVSYLTEELVAQGHDVTLFASGDSETTADLVVCTERALRLDGIRNGMPAHLAQVQRVRRLAQDFDVVHWHGALHLPMSQPRKDVTTFHGRMDEPEWVQMFRSFTHLPFVSISNDQRRPMPWLNWADTIPHGLPKDLLTFSPKSQGYLAFLGRIAPEKRPDRAIRIAARAGMPLKMAAKIDAVDKDYWKQVVEPLVHRYGVEFIGEIGEHEKSAFLGGASALLFPIDWPEPFGLVMIEAMACGTPVIAFRNGSVPEIIEDGFTGCIVDHEVEAVEAVPEAMGLNRELIRARFEERFTAGIMATRHVALYDRISGRRIPRRAIGAV